MKLHICDPFLKILVFCGNHCSMELRAIDSVGKSGYEKEKYVIGFGLFWKSWKLDKLIICQHQGFCKRFSFLWENSCTTQPQAEHLCKQMPWSLRAMLRGKAQLCTWHQTSNPSAVRPKKTANESQYSIPPSGKHIVLRHSKWKSICDKRAGKNTC